MRAMRSHTASPSTTKPFASSDVPRVTTETTIGSFTGENSKQSFAHTVSDTWSEQDAGVERRREADRHARAEREVAGRVADERSAVERGRPPARPVDEPVRARDAPPARASRPPRATAPAGASQRIGIGIASIRSMSMECIPT